MAHSVGAVEYSDCFSVGRQDSPNKSPGYNTKQSDGEASSNVGALGNVEYPYLWVK